MSRKHVSHRMRVTSIKAYGEVPDLGEMQQRVFNAIIELNMEGRYPTDRELAKDLGFSDPNNVRPRRHELMESGLIIEAGRRKCRESGRTAITWAVSPHLKTKLEKR